jgi:membrane glycosyltransferase
MANFPMLSSEPASQCTLSLPTRRVAFAALVIGTTGVLAAQFVAILAVGGFGVVEALMVGAFIVKTAWVVIFFWHAMLGFVLLQGAQHPIDALVQEGTVSCNRVAIAMTACNEDSTAIVARLKVMKASLDATGFGEHFDYFLLSDTSLPEVIEAEERAAAAWSREAPAGRIVYRRRAATVGFKGGNVREFCGRWGKSYELMVLLDADSLLTADAILRLVRIMQVNPRLGILQSLIVGIRSRSLFARVFEFGHRHSMRSAMPGAVWWQSERGQYRGHNAAIRVAPFAEACHLAETIEKRGVKTRGRSHDQLEAALLHAAGFGVRELSHEGGSYEELPPTLLDFTTRYNQWMQGNFENLRFLRLPGLTAMDRYHLAAVAHRFLGWPAMVLFVALVAFKVATWPSDAPAPAAGSVLALYLTYFGLYFAPRALGMVSAALSGPAAYGGVGRLLLGGLMDIVLTLLFVPIAMVTATLFIARLPFSGAPNWEAPRREGYQLHWSDAARHLWPQTVIGCALLAFLAATAPHAIPWFLPFVTSLVVAVPFAVITSSPGLGEWAARHRLCVFPEEVEMPSELRLFAGALGR